MIDLIKLILLNALAPLLAFVICTVFVSVGLQVALIAIRQNSQPNRSSLTRIGQGIGGLVSVACGLAVGVQLLRWLSLIANSGR